MLDPNTFLVDSLNLLYLRRQQPRPALAVWGRIMLALLLPLVVLECGLWVWALHECLRTEQLYLHGGQIEAMITSRQVGRDGWGRVQFVVAYGFVIEHIQYRGSSAVAGDVYGALGNMQAITVRYVRQAPNLSEIARRWPWWATVWLSTLALLLRLLLMVVLDRLWRRARQEWLLRHYGQALQGVIQQAQGSIEADGSWLLHLEYRFTTPEGVVIEQTTRRICNHLRGSKTVPAVGTPLGVWYVSPQLFVLL